MIRRSLILPALAIALVLGVVPLVAACGDDVSRGRTGDADDAGPADASAIADTSPPVADRLLWPSCPADPRADCRLEPDPERTLRLSSPFDGNGCVRPSCDDDTQCLGGQRCYRPSEAGGCLEGITDCRSEDSASPCACIGDGTCDAGHCVPEALVPTGVASACGDVAEETSCRSRPDCGWTPIVHRVFERDLDVFASPECDAIGPMGGSCVPLGMTGDICPDVCGDDGQRVWYAMTGRRGVTVAVTGACESAPVGFAPCVAAPPQPQPWLCGCFCAP